MVNPKNTFEIIQMLRKNALFYNSPFIPFSNWFYSHEPLAICLIFVLFFYFLSFICSLLYALLYLPDFPFVKGD